MIKFKSIRENVNEALRNPYKGKPERDLKRKLDSFESQLQDLIKKSRGRQRREIEGEIRDMETKVQQVKAALKENVNEDGHDDVASMKTKVKVAMSALQKMDQELSKLSDGDSLPTWWTNKVAVAVDKLDGMADYLDTKVESVNEALSGLRGKDGKTYKVDVMKSGRKIQFKITNQFGDYKTINLKQAAKLFEEQDLEKLQADD